MEGTCIGAGALRLIIRMDYAINCDNTMALFILTFRSAFHTE